MEYDVGLELLHQSDDAVAISNIGYPSTDRDASPHGRKGFGNGIKSRFGIFDHQQPRGSECRYPLADFRTDRTPTAGDDDRFVLHQGFQTGIVDVFTGAQQQIFDGNCRQARRVPYLE